jgi:uncharacterized phage protein (TIGR01671 family)
MKEILFRGKRVDNDEWVYGDLIHRQVWSTQLTIIRISDDGFDHYEEFEVKPETVGQFTGLTDKNGNEIFEGDIVKEWSSHWKTPLKTEINIYEVVCEYLGSLHLIRKTEYGENSTPLYRRSVVEVIGNIYDNKELLGND